MKVQNKLAPKGSYNSQPAEAANKICPCCTCYSIHNFGERDGRGIFRDEYRCLRREQQGCPDSPTINHLPFKTVARCKRCCSMLKVKCCSLCGQGAKIGSHIIHLNPFNAPSSIIEVTPEQQRIIQVDYQGFIERYEALKINVIACEYQNRTGGG